MYNHYRGLNRPLSVMYQKYIKSIEAATTEPPMKSLSDPAQPVTHSPGKSGNLPTIVPVAMKRKAGASGHDQVAVQMSGSWTAKETSPTPKAVDWALPDLVMEPGRYAIPLQYTKGKSGYQIHAVEIVQDGKVLAQDKHEGSTGKSSQDNVYHVDLPKFSSAPLILRATVSTDAGPDSNGQILMEKAP